MRAGFVIWDKLAEMSKTELLRVVIGAAIALLVLVSAKLGRPRKREASTEFPPALGTRIVLCAVMLVWVMLILASLDVGMNWLAFIFLGGALWMLWRWPAKIAVNETSIRSLALLRGEVRMYWTEVESISQSSAGDSLVLKSRHGEKISVPNTQVGADELVELIQHKTGIKCPALDTGVLG